MTKAERDLQWYELLTLIADFCLSELGAARLAGLKPLDEPQQAAQRQEMVRECMALTATSAPLPLKRFDDLTDFLAQLSRGAVGSAEQLRDTARVIGIAATLRGTLKEHAERAPTTARALWTASELDALGARLRRAVGDNGELLDDASQALGEARHRLQRQRQRVRESQASLLRRYGPSLSGQFFAERDGRYVLPVRTDAAGQVPGIVLGSSGSGGTIYVEPREMTEANNKLRIAEAEVAQEEAKVLAELSQAAGQFIVELEQAQEALITADGLRAISQWAALAKATPLNIHHEASVTLKQARHPLLLGGETPPVANDMRAASGECLVISGPNAGGKTVAMKCLGLAALCVRAGLPFPCAPESQVGWFSDVFSDIGDDQSLSRSLSTFSAHITNIAEALSNAHGTQLVLLDELAGGTDPEEGAALAAAILEAFVARGAAVVATTHYEKLKQLGAAPETPFRNASVGFDLAALRPTFALALDIPGASSAFAVAAYYGIPRSVVTRASELVPKEQLDQQRLIEQLETERQRLAALTLAAEDELAAAQARAAAQEQELEQTGRKERARLNAEAQKLSQEVREARLRLQQARSLWLDPAATKRDLREAEALVSQAAAPITVEGTLTVALAASPALPLAPADTSFSVGQQVHLPHLNTKGEVAAIRKDGTLSVSVGGLKLNLPASKVRILAKQTPNKATQKRRPKSAVPTTIGEGFTPVRTTANTCDLRGQRVEAGLEELDAFIDRMLNTSEHAAFILHGHGTGAMKAAVREHLAASPYVTKHGAAEAEDGGDALTLFWLKG